MVWSSSHIESDGDLGGKMYTVISCSLTRRVANTDESIGDLFMPISALFRASEARPEKMCTYYTRERVSKIRTKFDETSEFIFYSMRFGR